MNNDSEVSYAVAEALTLSCAEKMASMTKNANWFNETKKEEKNELISN